MYGGRRYTFPKLQGRQTFSAATATRRNAAIAARTLARFRVLTSRRTALGLPATRGFRPLGLRGTGEKKVIDSATATHAVNTTGDFTLLNGCVQGSDYTNRIGRKIVMKSLYIRGYTCPEPSTAGAGGSVAQQARMIIFMDNQPNGAAPAVTDLLNTATSTSQLNLNNRDRFKILRDQTFVLSPQQYSAANVLAATGSPAVADVNCYAKLRHETIFNAGNAGTIGDINSGALYMFWIGSNSSGVGTDAVAVVSARVRFLDP